MGKGKLLLTPGEDSFTLTELLKKVADYKSLKLREDASELCSKDIATVALDKGLLAFLKNRNIKPLPRHDCRNGIFTLVDENSQVAVHEFGPSNFWSFIRAEGDKRRFDLRIRLSVNFQLNSEDRGCRLWPLASGTFFSPADHLPNFRMFKALVESDTRGLPTVAYEIAESGGYIVVTWADLGLGGLRRVEDLFVEFSKGNYALEEIARRGALFDPQPYPLHKDLFDALFISEMAQPKVFEAWCAQLKGYREQLVV